MKIALLSDIHGNLAALEAVASHIRYQCVDHVVNLGDSLSGPLLPVETAQFLISQGWPSLAGNHERQLLTQAPEDMGASDAYTHSKLTPAVWDWLARLPTTLRWSTDVLLCHGTPSSDVGYFLDTVEAGLTRLASRTEINQRMGVLDSAITLIGCGHTHMPRVVRSADGVLLVNPGSVGLPAYDDRHPTAHVVQTGSPDARYALVERQPQGGWVVGLYSVPYDYEPMARMAERNGRPDWAYALRTGYMSAELILA